MPAPTGRRLEALEPQPDERRGDAWPHCSRQPCAQRQRYRASSASSPAVAVAVLEVEPQVLDRFAAQLGLDAGRDLDDEIIGSRRPTAHDLLHAAVLLHRGQRRLPPLLRQVGDEAVGRHIDGVHRLAAPVVAGVTRLPGRRRCSARSPSRRARNRSVSPGCGSRHDQTTSS